MFQFRFQSLLLHRKHLEDLCQKSLARVQNELLSETRRLNELGLRKEEQQRRMQQIQAEAHTAAQVQPHQNYLKGLDRDIDLQAQRIHELKQKVAEERRKLTDAMKNRKILERLKETERNRYQRKRLQEEQELMNEVASQRYIRKNPT